MNAEERGSTAGQSARRERKWNFGLRKSGDLDHRTALVLGAALATAGLVAMLYLGLSSYILLRARHIQALREELLRLQQENAFLEQRISERLQTVIQAVPNLGFVPATQTEIVSP